MQCFDSYTIGCHSLHFGGYTSQANERDRCGPVASKSHSVSFKWRRITHQQYYNRHMQVDVLHVVGNAEICRTQACFIYSLRFSWPPTPRQRSTEDIDLQEYHE